MSEEFDGNGGAIASQPAWWTAMQADYRAGMANVFLLHGNTQDYVEHPRVDRSLRDYLEQRLGLTHTVASFAPDQGVTFPGTELVAREARAWFDQVLGVTTPAPDPNDMAALIRAQGGEAGGAQQDDLTKMAAPQAIPLMLDYARQSSTEEAGCPQGVAGRDADRRLFPKRAAVIVERMDLICPPDDKARLGGGAAALLARLYRAGSDSQINGRRNLVILLAPSLEEVHPDLRLADSSIRAIEVTVPDQEQRARYIQRMLPARRVTLDGLTPYELASATAGLNRRHIEDIAMRASAAGGLLTQEMVKARKNELIRAEYAEVLTVLETDITLDQVGGHDAVKSWLQRRVLKLMADPTKRHRCPMGVLFAGPSGTGKTFLARAVASALGINCVEMSPENMRGSYVGESEKKLKRGIQGVKAMSPCVLFIDEIDTKIRRPSGGGGGGDSVEGNLFGKLLEFLSDTSHRGQILLIAATNRPDNIDAALKRPGRIDAKIPLLPPDSAEERADALTRLAIRHGVTGMTDEAWLAIGADTDLYTQAELEGLIVAAAAIAETDEIPIGEAFQEALEEVVPSTDDIKLHTDLAIAVCSNRRLVPERYRTRVGKQLPRRAAAATPGARVGVDDAVLADEFELE